MSMRGRVRSPEGKAQRFVMLKTNTVFVCFETRAIAPVHPNPQ
jgi:hypothetical protein